MNTLSDFTTLDSLPLSSTLKNPLMNELIERPIENLVYADQFWQETSTQLILLESRDHLQVLKSHLPAHHLHSLTHFP